jgi:hypothetical protein
MIKVQKNKNILFLSFLVNLTFVKKEYDKYLLPLGAKIYKDLEYIQNTKEVQKFVEEYKDQIPLQLYFQYMQLSLFLNDDFNFVFNQEEEELLEKSQVHKRHVKIIESAVKAIYDKVQFDKYFEKEVSDEYDSLSQNIQELFDEKQNIQYLLEKFWKISLNPQLLFIPNIVSLGDCFGLGRGNNFYSISSGKIDSKSNVSEYTPVHVYSNAIHEFSHQYFKEHIKELNLEKDLYEKSTEILKKKKLDKKIINIYKEGYLEECIIRAYTIRMKELLNIYDITKKELKEKVSKMLESEISIGYIHVPVIYDTLVESENDSLVIMEIINSL